jgi:ABC-type multidrug transport system fused ATPase/permease subunit
MTDPKEIAGKAVADGMSDPAARSRPSRDDSPAPTLRRYIWLMTGWWQVWLALLAIAVAGLNLAPIELQRRIIDNALAEKDAALLMRLGALYAGALILHQLAKITLRMGQGWVGERTSAYTRRHLYGLERHEAQRRPGALVSVLVSEVDKLGGFVGGGPSKAVGNLAMLVGVFGYMIYVEPRIAALSILLLVPQAVVAPLIQRRLNRMIARRLTLLRRFGDEASEGAAPDIAGQTILSVLRNRLGYIRLKAVMKASLNLLNGVAPLAILLWGGWLVIEGETTVGVLVALVSGFNRIADPTRELIAFYREAAQASVQHEQIAAWMRGDEPADSPED